MKVIFLFTVLISAICAFPNENDELQFKRIYSDPVEGFSIDLTPRITNGVEAVPHSIPYQAYLIITGNTGSRWLCGGSLISPRHVLTAGHCVDDGISATIYLGAHDLLGVEPNRLIIESQNLIRHENYSNKTYSNDIGVIVLDEPVELNEYIDVVALPTRGDNTLFEGANVRVSGWGRVAGDKATSPVLLEVNSTVISNSECRAIYSIVIDSQICISGAGGVGSCSGDSGGPLIYKNFQIGIVSYGASGCVPGYPSGFTRITSFFDWIEEKTDLKF